MWFLFGNRLLSYIPNEEEISMMPDSPEPSNSPYAALYDILIPADHEYRRLHDVISFDFVFDELKDTYCHDNGRMILSDGHLSV